MVSDPVLSGTGTGLAGRARRPLRRFDVRRASPSPAASTRASFCGPPSAASAPEQVVAFTAVSPTYLPEELDAARRLAGELGVELVDRRDRRVPRPALRQQPAGPLLPLQAASARGDGAAPPREHGARGPLDGANHDDLGDDRPGMRAAARARACDIRCSRPGSGRPRSGALARAAGLPTWDTPQQACLASRIPYGEAITAEKLAAVARRGGGAARARLQAVPGAAPRLPSLASRSSPASWGAPPARPARRSRAACAPSASPT